MNVALCVCRLGQSETPEDELDAGLNSWLYLAANISLWGPLVAPSRHLLLLQLLLTFTTALHTFY
jgi:hypothetical protein